MRILRHVLCWLRGELTEAQLDQVREAVRNGILESHAAAVRDAAAQLGRYARKYEAPTATHVANVNELVAHVEEPAPRGFADPDAWRGLPIAPPQEPVEVLRQETADGVLTITATPKTTEPGRSPPPLDDAKWSESRERSTLFKPRTAGFE